MKNTKKWGEYFPIDLCPFGYNETIAMDHFPLTKDEALKKGYKWSDYETPPPVVKKTVSSDRLPKQIADIPDQILDWAIICQASKKPFKLTKRELAFYRKMNIPCPHLSPDQRHIQRMAKRPLYQLINTTCNGCGKEIKCNSVSINSEKTLCDSCYSKEIY